MDTEKIYNVDIPDFESIKDRLEYLDDNVLISQNLCFPFSTEEIKRNMIRVQFFLMVSCNSGSVKFTVNEKSYFLRKDSVFFILPSMVVQQLEKVSDDLQIRFIGFSKDFLNNVLNRQKGVDNFLYKIYQNPLWHVEDKENAPIIHAYENLLMAKIKDTSNHYQKEILKNLFSAMFCEMMNELQSRIGEVTKSLGHPFRRSSYVFKEFLKLLSKDGGMHRSVSYYADQLCYSPKYVSSVVKEVSGRTALDWINDITMSQIKYQLKTSDSSIKEIADSFNFPNQSFFGKYVKKHLGMSPAKYRNQSIDEDF